MMFDVDWINDGKRSKTDINDENILYGILQPPPLPWPVYGGCFRN